MNVVTVFQVPSSIQPRNIDTLISVVINIIISANNEFPLKFKVIFLLFC